MRTLFLVIICQLFVLPLALAKTDSAPGPHSTVSYPTVDLAEQVIDSVPPPVALDDDDPVQVHYEWLNIQGFDVQVQVPQEMDVDTIADYTQTINLLNRQLERAKGVLPEYAVAKLQSGLYIFIGDDCTVGGSAYYWRNDDTSDDDTPDRGWIVLLCFHYLSNVLDDAYHGGESIQGRVVWGNYGLVLHELAHGWHDLFVDDGFENRMIREFYDHAKACMGNVNDPYYWETDGNEFFAEFSVMYYLTHWDPPGRVWNMQRKYRILVIRLWHGHEYENWENELASC